MQNRILPGRAKYACLHWFFLVLAGIFPRPGWGDSFAIGMIDMPVNYRDGAINKFYADALAENPQSYGPAPRTLTTVQAWRLYAEVFGLGVHSPRSLNLAAQKGLRPTVCAQFLELFSPKKSSWASSFHSYLHGPVVASILAKDLEPSRFQIHPFISDVRNPFVMSQSDEGFALGITEWRNAISKQITKHRVRVINVSGGIFFDRKIDSGQKLLKWSSFLDRKIARLLEKRKVRNQSIAGAFQGLVADHPDTMFVVAAGNASKSLESLPDWDVSRLEGPNVITVYGATFNGRATLFSNYSENAVRIAAPGKNIPVEFAGNTGTVSGTSFAAPLVANRLAEFWERNPTETVASILNEFLAAETKIVLNLKRTVCEGRMLKPRKHSDRPWTIANWFVEPLQLASHLESWTEEH